MINKGLYKIATFFLFLFSLLPLRFLYLVSELAFFVLFYLIKYRRNVVQDNLRNSFPQKTQSELHQIEKEYFAYLSDLMVESIKMISASPTYLQKRYTFTNKELVDHYENQNKSYFIAVGHYGNWEWNTIVIPLVIKAKPMIIYKPLNNELFNEFFKKIREKSGTLMIRMKVSLKEIIRHKGQLTATVFASDQTPALGDAQDWITFLNQPTAVFVGLEKIAKSINYPVIFCDMRRVKRGYYSCDFKLVCDNPSETSDLEITKKHVSLLEDRINAEPNYWLWSHKRWKYKPKNGHE